MLPSLPVLCSTVWAELKHLLPRVKRTNSTWCEITALPFTFTRVILLPAIGMADFCMNNKIRCCFVYLNLKTLQAQYEP